MPKSSKLAAAMIAAGLLACAGVTVAQDSAIDVAGWKLTDVGHKPGDDSDRVVSIEKAIPEVSLFYQPSESNTGGSIHGEFRGCKGLNYSSGFGFDDPPADRAAEVRKQVHEALTDFARPAR